MGDRGLVGCGCLHAKIIEIFIRSSDRNPALLNKGGFIDGYSVGQGLALRMEKKTGNRPGFPTTRLQKGLALFDGDQELEEEGVGFGVPIVMPRTPDPISW